MAKNRVMVNFYLKTVLFMKGKWRGESLMALEYWTLKNTPIKGSGKTTRRRVRESTSTKVAKDLKENIRKIRGMDKVS